MHLDRLDQLNRFIIIDCFIKNLKVDKWPITGFVKKVCF